MLPAWHVVWFLIGMTSVGVAEEFLFRGVIAQTLLEHFEMCIRDRAGTVAAGGQDTNTFFHIEQPSFLPFSLRAVSYTHLDVYKRQPPFSASSTCWRRVARPVHARSVTA